jgi:hypothetical protein
MKSDLRQKAGFGAGLPATGRVGGNLACANQHATAGRGGSMAWMPITAVKERLDQATDDHHASGRDQAQTPYTL